jgi:cold shock CspA family protein
MSRRHQGFVKRFDPAKRFGFLVWNGTVDNATVLFFHVKECERADDILDLPEGVEVEFSLARDGQGRQKAVDVRFIGESAA